MLKKLSLIAGLLLVGATAQAAVPGMNGTAATGTVVTVAKEQVQQARYVRRTVVVRRRYVAPGPHVYVRVGRHPRVGIGF